MSVANAPGNELVRRNAYLALSGSIVNYSKISILFHVSRR
jgi:hypothetical protein